MKPSEIKTLFDYNFWAFERVWECIAQLSDEQFIQEIDYSTGSIRNIIVHMMTANRIWMNRLKGTEMPPRLIVEDFDSLAKTRAKWDELQHEFLDDLDSLSALQLEETFHWEILGHGWKSDNPRWEILLHLAIHATDHRSQILAILHHHFRANTVEQDMIIYLAERNLESF